MPETAYFVPEIAHSGLQKPGRDSSFHLSEEDDEEAIIVNKQVRKERVLS